MEPAKFQAAKVAADAAVAHLKANPHLAQGPLVGPFIDEALSTIAKLLEEGAASGIPLAQAWLSAYLKSLTP